MTVARRPEWDGKTVVCIASGPSLTAEDCELVRRCGHPVIVTNTTYRLCPWADMLFGFDLKWWRVHLDEVRTVFRGRLLSASTIAPNYGIETTAGAEWLRVFGNSGACAASVAIGGGASKVVLLGYDAMLGLDGSTHHHGDHPPGLRSAESMPDWPRLFANFARYVQLRGVNVVNASRRSALTCFPRQPLESSL